MLTVDEEFEQRQSVFDNLLKSIELDMRSNLEQNIEKLQRGIQNKMELVKRDEL